MKKILTFSLIVITSIAISSGHSMANDAPLNLASGVASPVNTSSLKVRMVSETVQIELNKDNYVVDAEFTFYNESSKQESIPVGFPKRSEGYLDERYKTTDDFIKFEAWVNGKPAEVKEETDISTLEANASIPEILQTIKKEKSEGLPSATLFGREYKWMVRKVDFPPRQKTITRVRYSARYQDLVRCYGARYIFGTGSYWHGKIGSSRFIITCNTDEGCWDQVQDCSKGKKYKINRKKTKKNTVEYIMKDFKPDEGDQIFMTMGCPD